MILRINKAGPKALPPGAIALALGTLPPKDRFSACLFAAADADQIDLLVLTEAAARWPGRDARISERPTVALIGDDPGTRDGLGGPSAWRCAPALRSWRQGVIVHGAGGSPEHYAEAVRAAHMIGRIAFIETTSGNAPSWVDYLACETTLLIKPKGGPHPLDLRVLH